MAVRTSEAAVGLIIETSLTSAQVVQFIADASLWVDTNLADAGLTSSLLEAIERYLAASFISARDPRLKSTKRLNIADTYVRDDKLDPYMKIAIQLDPTGTVEEQFGDEPTRFGFRVGAGYDADLDLPVAG